MLVSRVRMLVSRARMTAWGVHMGCTLTGQGLTAGVVEERKLSFLAKHTRIVRAGWQGQHISSREYTDRTWAFGHLKNIT
jgi:hypothetical protein